MAAADYRIMTDATGQRIATALEAQSIDKAAKTDLTSIIATGTTNATGAAIAAGTYFYLNGALVHALANIASGATFTSGTNYEAVTAGGLNALNDHMATITTLLGSKPTMYKGTSGSSEATVEIPFDQSNSVAFVFEYYRANSFPETDGYFMIKVYADTAYIVGRNGATKVLSVSYNATSEKIQIDLATYTTIIVLVM